MEQITIDDIKKDYVRQVRGNAVKARSIEVLEAENKKLTRQLGKYRKAQLAWYGEKPDEEKRKVVFSLGMVAGAVLATVVYIIAMNIAFA